MRVAGWRALGGRALEFLLCLFTCSYFLLLRQGQQKKGAVCFFPSDLGCHAKISPSFWLFDGRAKRWFITPHPSDSLAVDGLAKEANSGKINGKPVLGSDLIVKAVNEERRNHSQESAKILNSNAASTFLHELVHADLSYVLSLIGSKKESWALVVIFKMLWVQQPALEDGIFSCMTYSKTFVTI